MADGATVQILYEGRQPKTKVTGDSLDNLFDQYFADYSEQEKEQIKNRYGTQQASLEAPDRIKQICQDMVQHYRQVVEPNGFKAMIVTTSRQAAVTYKETIDQIDAPYPQSLSLVITTMNRIWFRIPIHKNKNNSFSNRSRNSHSHF